MLLASLCAPPQSAAGHDACVGLAQQTSVVRSGEMHVGEFPECLCLAVRLPLPLPPHGWLLRNLMAKAAAWRARPMLMRAAVERLGRGPAEAAVAAGILEVFRPRGEGAYWALLPLTGRSSMLPFD